MKRIGFILLACLLMAGTATAREVTQGLVQGKGDLVNILDITAAELTGTGTCLNVNGGVATLDSVACDDPAVNAKFISRSAKVSNLRVTVTSTGDSGYICVFTIEIDGTATGNTLTTTATALEDAVFNQAQNFVVNAGEQMAIMVANGTTCGGTADPSFSVQVEGRYLSTD